MADSWFTYFDGAYQHLIDNAAACIRGEWGPKHEDIGYLRSVPADPAQHINPATGNYNQAYWIACMTALSPYFAAKTKHKYFKRALHHPLNLAQINIVVGAFSPWHVNDLKLFDLVPGNNEWVHREVMCVLYYKLIKTGIITPDNQKILHKLNPMRLRHYPDTEPFNRHSSMERLCMFIALRAAMKRGEYPPRAIDNARTTFWKAVYQNLQPQPFQPAPCYENPRDAGDTILLEPTLTVKTVLDRVRAAIKAWVPALIPHLLFEDLAEVTGEELLALDATWKEAADEWFVNYQALDDPTAFPDHLNTWYPSMLESYLGSRLLAQNNPRATIIDYSYADHRRVPFCSWHFFPGVHNVKAPVVPGAAYKIYTGVEGAIYALRVGETERAGLLTDMLSGLVLDVPLKRLVPPVLPLGLPPKELGIIRKMALEDDKQVEINFANSALIFKALKELEEECEKNYQKRERERNRRK